MSGSDRTLFVAVVALWVSGVGSGVGVALASTQRGRTIAVACLSFTFAALAMVFALNMVVTGQIGVGPRGGTVTEFIKREDQPFRFWSIFAFTISFSAIGVLIGVGFLTGVLVPPWQ
jgi:hypothetical protein